MYNIYFYQRKHNSPLKLFVYGLKKNRLIKRRLLGSTQLFENFNYCLSLDSLIIAFI